MGNPAILGLVKSLHDLFSIIWIGSLIFISLFMVSASKIVEDPKQRNRMLNNIFDKLSYFIVIAIVILFITGILEHRFAKMYALKSSKTISPVYNAIHIAKYILTGLMVIIALIRQIMRKKMKGKDAPKGKNPFILIYINTVIGVLIIFLSGFLSAFGIH